MKLNSEKLIEAQALQMVTNMIKESCPGSFYQWKGVVNDIVRTRDLKEVYKPEKTTL